MLRARHAAAAAARGLACAAAALVAAAPAAAWGAGSAGGGKGIDGVINLNTAPTDQLELLPGIGPAKVRSIVWYRQRHPFRTVDELVRIKGIGRKMVRKLRPHLAVAGPTTAQAVHLARGAQPPQPEARPPPPKPAAPRTTTRTTTTTATATTATSRPGPRPGPPARPFAPRPSPAAEARLARSPANHCRGRP